MARERVVRKAYVSVVFSLLMLFAALAVMMPAVGQGSNSPPDIMSEPVTYAYVGKEYNYQVLAIDYEGDHLTYTLFVFPNGMTIENDTGKISWTPTADQTGEQHIVGIAVLDPQGAKDMQNYTIEVYEPPPPYVEIWYPTWGQEVSATIYIKGMVYAGIFDEKGQPYNTSVKLLVEVMDQNKVVVASWNDIVIIDYSDYNRTIGEWKFEFDTKKVSDGKYILMATASDMSGLTSTAEVDFSIDNTHANDVIWFDKPQDQWTFKEPYVSFQGGAGKQYNITSVQMRIDYAYTDPYTQVIMDWTKVNWNPYTWSYGFDFTGKETYGTCYLVRVKAVYDTKELGSAKITICKEGITPPPPPSKIKVWFDSPADSAIVSGTFELVFGAYYEGPALITAYLSIMDTAGQGTSAVFTGKTDGQNRLVWNLSVDSTQFADGNLAISLNVTTDTGAYGYAMLALVVNNYVPPPSDFKMWVDKPADGSTVSGSLDIAFSAMPTMDGNLSGALTIEDSNKKTIEFYFSAISKKDQQLTWTYTWGTTAMADGYAVIDAKADLSGNGGIGVSYFRIMVTIKNGVTPPPPEKLDLQFTSPKDGSTVKGTVKFTGQTYYADNVRTLQVTMYLDGTEYVKVFSTGGGWKEWAFELDTTKLKDGTHTMNATCEVNGLKAAAHMKFVVNNGGVTPPPPVPPPVVPGGKVNDDGSVTIDDKEVEFEAPNIPGMSSGTLNYTWEFGDGTVSHEKNPTHTYKNDGDYNVKLTVTDGQSTKQTDLDLMVGKAGGTYTTRVPGFGAMALVLGLMIGCVAAFFRRRK